MPIDTEGSRFAARHLARALTTTFPKAEIDFEALAASIVADLDLNAVAYMDDRRKGFDKALSGLMDYQAGVVADLRQQIQTLQAELLRRDQREAASLTLEPSAGLTDNKKEA